MKVMNQSAISKTQSIMVKIFVVVKVYAHFNFSENLKAFKTEQEAVDFILEQTENPYMENFPVNKPMFRFQEIELVA